MICWRRRGMHDLIAVIDQNMNDAGRASTAGGGVAWLHGGAPWPSPEQLGPRLWSTGNNGSRGKSERGPQRIHLGGRRS
jgi:hypothetical protein